MSDDNGFLSWLMTQTVPVTTQDDDEREPIPAMQCMEAVVREAYNCGVWDERRLQTDRINKLRADYNNALIAKQEELKALSGKLQAANEREVETAKTVAALRTQLEAMQAPAAPQTSTPETPVSAEPQLEPVAAPTNGGSDESGNGTNGQ